MLSAPLASPSAHSASLFDRAPLVIAHRGASGHRPEHSASAYRLACELGADAVEPDVVATKDGVLVVRHENEISGTTDVADRPEFADRRTDKVVDGKPVTGWFTEDFTWDELSALRCRERLPEIRPGSAAYDGREPVLRLSDVLAIVDAEGERSGRRIGAVVEIKHARYFLDLGIDLGALLLAELARCGWADRPELLVVECFELSVLERVRAAGLAAPLVFLAESLGHPADQADADPHDGAPFRDYAWYRGDAGLDLLASRVDGIGIAKADLIGADGSVSDIAERAHARGLRLLVWTLRPENRFLRPAFRSSERPGEWGDWRGEFGRVLRAGADGIFADHPELGVEVRAEPPA